MDKLQEIKENILTGHNTLFGSRWVSMPEPDCDWLISEIERLRIVEQAYEGMKKAL